MPFRYVSFLSEDLRPPIFQPPHRVVFPIAAREHTPLPRLAAPSWTSASQLATLDSRPDLPSNALQIWAVLRDGFVSALRAFVNERGTGNGQGSLERVALPLLHLSRESPPPRGGRCSSTNISQCTRRRSKNPLNTRPAGVSSTTYPHPSLPYTTSSKSNPSLDVSRKAEQALWPQAEDFDSKDGLLALVKHGHRVSVVGMIVVLAKRSGKEENSLQGP
ncbi:hypothetical protein CVT26_014474 [Gymnopilus dilepis]|uniref:Uncharacterized protein n=1 Tax=Gymnopilus dilepis TaxID=231916 RepID=A0A409VVE3_9AGAR|nr:hypothetical protein CVT26_014474 [Gymnopilus dilepis]